MLAEGKFKMPRGFVHFGGSSGDILTQDAANQWGVPANEEDAEHEGASGVLRRKRGWGVEEAAVSSERHNGAGAEEVDHLSGQTESLPG